MNGRIDLTFGRYAWLGLFGLTLVYIPTGLYWGVAPGQAGADFDVAVFIYTGFGLIFAPLWSGTFAVLYRSFAKLQPDLSPSIERKTHA